MFDAPLHHAPAPDPTGPPVPSAPPGPPPGSPPPAAGAAGGSEPPDQGYDPAAAEAQAEALCATANRKVIGPLMKLLGTYRLAVGLALLPVAVGAIVCGLDLSREDDEVAACAVLATALAPCVAYLLVRLNFLALHEADYERELLFALDLGAERRTSAAEFAILDTEACLHGLQDFAGRTRALIALTRRMDRNSALLAKDVRYLCRTVIVLVCLLAAGGAATLAWRAAHGADLQALAETAGALMTAILVGALILWSARKHIDELLTLLAPPADSGDAFVIICARILDLLREVIAQNDFLRKK
jgi:hypothetical protein